MAVDSRAPAELDSLLAQRVSEPERKIRAMEALRKSEPEGSAVTRGEERRRRRQQEAEQNRGQERGSDDED
jgi:hypothetical protein